DGATGAAGATGATGPTGTIAASAHIFNVGTQTITTGNPVSFDTNGTISGTDITHAAGSPNIVLAQNHIYHVIYTFVGDASVSEVSVHFTLAGTDIPGSGFTDPSSAALVTASQGSGKFIISTVGQVVPTNLNMIVDSTTDITFPVQDANHPNISIVIIELS
ncbi:hypothetical protein ABWK22_23060, partial [Gottfriedia acidiceleris]